MFVSDLDLGGRFRDMWAHEGVSELYPPQADAVSAGILAGNNLILATPTASGKTLASEFAIAAALENKKKALYIVPLRALAFEKYYEFKKFEALGYRVRLEVGDMDSSRYSRKPAYDILVATAEKCDSILRSKPEWFAGLGVLVLDEIHLIASDRGPVYEILAAKLKKQVPGLQVVGLSATIGNARELARWLDAELVESTWRPVDLSEWVTISQGPDHLTRLVRQNLKEGGQVMVFVNSRKSAEATAEKLGRELKFSGLDGKVLTDSAERILGSVSSPTRQCRRLTECVKKGTAFHHAGLVNKQRTEVENLFKDGKIKVISATPTLAAGVNLPSRTVVIRDIKRYGIEGLDYIPVLEYKQQAGRAGRPKYDDRGIAVTLAKSESEAEYIEEHYINGEVEPITSRLGVEPVLRFHVLAATASGFTRTEEALLEFFKQTFFGFQYGVAGSFENLIRKVVDELIEWDFVQLEKRFLVPTALGSRVSELYVDPLTAKTYLDLLTTAELRECFSDVGLLEMLCDAAEMPDLPVRGREESQMWTKAYGVEEGLLRDIGGFDLDWGFLSRFKTALMFSEWVDEKTEDEILESYNVAPGQLNQRIQILEWLAYAAGELSRIKKYGKSEKALRNLETRIKYGVREELLHLVQIRGIGRVRARKLYQMGLRKPESLKKVRVDKLARVLGKKTAENIKRELGV